LTARPTDDSWEFDHWEGDIIESTEQQVSLRMDTAKRARAVFKASRPSERLLAAFSAAPLSGTAPLTVSFEDSSIGSPKEWVWDFDNNATNDSTESHPVFTYQEAGTYTVRLRISRDDSIDTEIKVGMITISE
jgi:PKD repeat protein